MRELGIDVPGPRSKEEEQQDETPLHLAEVYRPFVQALAGGEGPHKQMTPRDIRMYEALLARLKYYRDVGIDHQELNEVADYYNTQGLTYSEQRGRLQQDRDKAVAALKEPLRAPAPVPMEWYEQERIAGRIQQYETSLASGPKAAALLKPRPKKGSQREYYAHVHEMQRRNNQDWTYLVGKNPAWNDLNDRNYKHGLRDKIEQVNDRIKVLGFHSNKLGTMEKNYFGHLYNTVTHRGC